MKNPATPAYYHQTDGAHCGRIHEIHRKTGDAGQGIGNKILLKKGEPFYTLSDPQCLCLPAAGTLGFASPLFYRFCLKR
jgi:hypothetical protein